MGDFNCNTINKYDPSTNDFLSACNSFHPLHYLPTRVNLKSASTLDIIFTNMSWLPGIIINDISEHFPILSIIDMPSPDKTTKTLSQDICKRDIRMCKISKFKFLLHIEYWEDAYNYSSTDMSNINITKCFLENLNIYLPKICFRPSTNGKK